MSAPSSQHGLGRSWPLLTIASLAFLPGLGVVFGFVAACWGLVTTRPRGLVAAAIGAAGMLANFAGCAILVVRQASGGYGLSVVRGQAINQDLVLLVQQIEAQKAATGRYPSNLTALQIPPLNHPSPVIFDRGIGWLNRRTPYQYELDSAATHYRLSSVGLDGKAGTGDEMYPLLPDSLRRLSGFQHP